MSAPTARTFDPCGELPHGVTVLEASAGTGKTYTIAALAARYVAEGVPLERILLVTFTRMATGELRERVRERLVASEQALARLLAQPDAVDRELDRVSRFICEAPLPELALRRERLLRAVTNFDDATIATTHAFCQEVLAELGTLADIEPETTFSENLDELVDEVVDDLFVRAFVAPSDQEALTRAEVGDIARVVVANPLAPLVPAQARSGSATLRRVRLGHVVRQEVERRKRRTGVMSYDDLLLRLRGTLVGPNGAAAIRRLSERFGVVLIDEFQDTDPLQWEIIQRAFTTAAGFTLILIADPKQAIYAFRGADVYAYLRAARSPDVHATLDVNWRSDERLISAYDALLSGADLGHPGIVYRPVRATPGNHGSRLLGAPGGALRLRIARRGPDGVRATRAGYAQVDSAREVIAADLCGEMVRLLECGVRREIRTRDGGVREVRPLVPGDIAILVRRHWTAMSVHEALRAAAVPSVVGGAGSVFATPVAHEWLWLLEAIEQPASSSRARKAAISSFFGRDARWVAGAREADLEILHQRLHHLSRVLRENGVAALFTALSDGECLPGRLLGELGGERRITDMRHLAQLMHHASSAQSLGTAALTGWLRQRILTAEEKNSDEERTRRLESDDEAVQVMTIHRSKGLEFPVVLCPDLWDFTRPRTRDAPVAFHDPQHDDELTLDVGLDPAHGYQENRRRAEAEEQGESLRLAYVALTRAMHCSVVWWAGSWGSPQSALSRLLFDRDEGGAILAAGRGTPGDDFAEAQMRELSARAPGCITVEPCERTEPSAWTGPLRERATLSVARFSRRLDSTWRRSSYSSLTAAAGDPHVASEPEDPVLADEPEGSSALPDPPAGERGQLGLEAALASPMASLPVGTEFGTAVHRVLERVDFSAGDLSAELGAACATAAGGLLDRSQQGVLAAALEQVLLTPLGPLLGGAALRGLAAADRLDELSFELPLVGGELPRGQLELAALADLLEEQLPPEDPLAPYAVHLRDPALATELRGYLNGSIDLLARFAPRAGGCPSYAVFDYKTNWLGEADADLHLGHYRPSALRETMFRSHYALQALLYGVAAHRYLRWRLPGYRTERDLAGIFYLFVRGMTGAGTPLLAGTPAGVFAWRPPSGLLEQLSDLLDRGAGR